MPSRAYALSCVLVTLGCASGKAEPKTAAGQAPVKPLTLSCPSLSADQRNIAQLFGVDAELGARLERTLRYAETLRRSAQELAAQATEACRVVTVDLRGNVAPGEHACTSLSKRVEQLKQALGSGGFSAQVSGLSCTVPTDSVATCAGECLTGQADVLSAVSCGPGLPQSSCSLDFSLPNASRECAAQCAASALSRVSCTARVEVRLGSADVTSTEYAEMAAALQRDLPRLFGLAASVAPRGAALANDAVKLVDDLASSIDALSSGKATLDRRAVTGLVLGGCVAPKLAEVLRESEGLRLSLGAVAEAQASFALP